MDATVLVFYKFCCLIVKVHLLNKFSLGQPENLCVHIFIFQAAGEAQNTSKKGTSSELNLNLELEDPDEDTDADMSTDEPRELDDSNPRPESRLKRKAF